MWKIYLATCQTSGKGYVGLTQQGVGVRWRQHLSEARTRKGKLLHKAIRRYGPESFAVTEIATVASYDEAIQAERDAVAKIGTPVPKGYNLTIGGDGVVGSKRSDLTRRKIGHNSANMSAETRERIASRLRGRKRDLTPEMRKKMSEMARARRHTPETRARMSERQRGHPDRRTPQGKASHAEKTSRAMKGRKLTPEHCAKIGAARKGMKFSDEWRPNIGAGSRGHITSEATRKKMSQAHLGQKFSEESIARMRVAARARMARRRELGLTNRQTPEGRANRAAAAARGRAALAAKRKAQT